MNDGRVFTRRDFFRTTAAGAAGLALGLPGLARADIKTVKRSTRVVLVRHPDAMADDGSSFNAEVVRKMVDDAVVALFEAGDPVAAFKLILKPSDILGIKTNAWQNLPTPKEVEQAVKRRALDAGVKEENISIRDRGLLQDPVFTTSTALINMRPLRTHHWSGIGSCLKNYITFHPTPSSLHDDSCADLGTLHKLPITAGKTRLSILVVMRPLFYGIGPSHFDPQHVWPYKGLLVGTDPVAVDSLGVKLLEEKRKRFFPEPPKGGTSTKHVRLADTRHGVGIANLDEIELIRLGWMDDVLL